MRRHRNRCRQRSEDPSAVFALQLDLKLRVSGWSAAHHALEEDSRPFQDPVLGHHFWEDTVPDHLLVEVVCPSVAPDLFPLVVLLAWELGHSSFVAEVDNSGGEAVLVHSSHRHIAGYILGHIPDHNLLHSRHCSHNHNRPADTGHTAVGAAAHRCTAEDLVPRNHLVLLGIVVVVEQVSQRQVLHMAVLALGSRHCRPSCPRPLPEGAEWSMLGREVGALGG